MRNLFKTPLFLLTLITCDLFSQELIYEFTPKGRLREINATTAGDTILLSYEESTGDSRALQSRWISDSSATPDNIDVNIFQAVGSGDNIYLYFLDGKPEKRVLKAVLYNKTKRSRVEVSNQVNLSGSIVGSYVNKNLFIMLLQDKGNTFAILEIDKLNIVSEKRYKLPVNLLNYLWKDFSTDVFYNESPIHSFKGWSFCKIFVRDNIFITVDQHRPNQPWRTIVLSLDSKSGDVKSTYYNTSSNAPFSSFILDGKLFRTFNDKKKYSLEIFSLEAKKLISKSEITADYKDFPAYFRHGRKNIINMKATFSDMRRGVQLSDPSLVVQKSNGRYFIQWGTYFNDNGIMTGGATPVGALTAIVGTAILQLSEGPGVATYFYYGWDEATNTFVVEETTPLARQKIDTHEITQDTEYKYKDYIEYRNGVAAIYYDAKNDKVSIYHFD